ncbi:autotransporter domain-containing protein [Limnobaculum zhutongyuii]|uniref:Autotransporter domain-containing protein n=1 Tax=Limnobaculum zhutongyuii TaxID=2498113 RepID=A0A411WN80_9GAMM|nr:S8 family serine peptidase [Limnobaculum zhutongyuii]QBH97617.1 autotransporter domain-containing protein [Limnobaculum zhutongyuii]TQS91092.1 autotransporter domain-containing protein [Limnobaculum zhutongyuii]
MNTMFDTFFDSAHQKSLITHKKQEKTTGLTKSAVALAIAAATLSMSGGASAAYVETGQIGDKTSWETEEYSKDWGLKAMKASSAYALGYYGQGVRVGVMDSGALLFKHSDLNGDRFHAVHASGVYGSSGLRYPQVATEGQQGAYEKGEAFDITGEWVLGLNDGHGTHVTGTVGANRDGEGMHGVAWGSDIYVGNNGGTDSNNYGPFQDYQYFYTGWKAMVDAGAEVINNSWGTNIRIVDRGTTGSDNGNTGVHLPADNINQSEYEYFYFNKMYGDNPSFVDAAYDAVKGTSVVQIFTTGNRDFANPFYRALYPYFNPEAEQHWIAVAGLQRVTGTDNYALSYTWNEAGDAKWWTVVAPGSVIYSTTVNSTTGEAGWGNSSGTSMSAPHVAGAMGVLMSRYQDMSAIQVRDVMFTTANHLNPDGSVLNGWTAADGVPDVRYGWGIPDLDKGMYGPGQFLGKFEYNMATTPLDVWSNDISQKGLDARQQEDLAWLQAYQANGIAAGGDYELGDDFVVSDGNSDPTDHIIDLADAEKWRQEYYDKRAAAIQAKIDAGLYTATLVKQGAGTLVMTGDNTYAGGTTVEGGTLYGFTESFGDGKVMVNGGQFGVISSYNDSFTLKGELTSTESHKANIEVNAGGTYVISAEESVNVGALTFNDGSMITVGSTRRDVFNDAYLHGITATGSVTADTLTDADKAIITPDYAFFKTDLAISDNTITATFGRNNDVSFASYGNHSNGRAIARAIEASGATPVASRSVSPAALSSGGLYDKLLTATKDEVRNTFNSLGSDMYLNTRNASIVNSMTTTQVIKDQAAGSGNGRKVEMADGSARLWMAGIGSWSEVDYGQSNMDVDFYAALIGVEADIAASTKMGMFFGTGSTKFKGGTHGKVDSNDMHLGLYGITNFAEVASLSYGLMYTHQDADAKRNLVVVNDIGSNSVSADADIAQIFTEAAYLGLNTSSYSIEPHLGFSWMHIKSDDYTETVSDMAFKTKVDDQDLLVTTFGVRGGLPFTVGELPMTVKADIYGMHFAGDNTAEATMYLADSGVANIKGGKLSTMAGAALGVEAQITKSASFGVSYTGAYNSDITSNGVYAKLKIDF